MGTAARGLLPAAHPTEQHHILWIHVAGDLAGRMLSCLLPAAALERSSLSPIWGAMAGPALSGFTAVQGRRALLITERIRLILLGAIWVRWRLSWSWGFITTWIYSLYFFFLCLYYRSAWKLPFIYTKKTFISSYIANQQLRDSIFTLLNS